MHRYIAVYLHLMMPKCVVVVCVFNQEKQSPHNVVRCMTLSFSRLLDCARITSLPKYLQTSYHTYFDASYRYRLRRCDDDFCVWFTKRRVGWKSFSHSVARWTFVAVELCVNCVYVLVIGVVLYVWMVLPRINMYICSKSLSTGVDWTASLAYRSCANENLHAQFHTHTHTQPH